jgi:PAS domain S-box-containing protein
MKKAPPSPQILIVDDHELFRRTLRSFIESRSNYGVCAEAGDGLEAIERARQLRPDVVLMDINMPRMDGLEATRTIRREMPDCHVILVTQNHATIAREQARTVKADGSITKSDLTRELIPTISKLFGDEPSQQIEPQSKREFDSASEWLVPGGALGKLVHDFDWGTTPLGPIQEWSQSLKNIVGTMLASRFPMWMSWGPELTFLYNDAYAKMTLGKKHPWALGQPSQAVWEEIWGDIAPRIHKVLETGQATWDEALLLFLERSGYREETYHTFSYSPLSDDDNKVAGHLCVVTEETDRVIGERRLGTLRSLAAELSKTITEEDVVSSVSRILEDNPKDLPFTLTYLLSEDRRQARLCCPSGLPKGHPAAPEVVDLNNPDSAWPLAALVAEGKDSLLVEDLKSRFQSIPTGAWDIPPARALLLPIGSQTQASPGGVLISGLNPYRPLDVSYAGFLNLVAGQIAASIANARAYTEEKKRAEALAEIDRAKTLFFSNVSHEFRTPLTLMLGPLEDMLAESGLLGPKQQERLDIAHRNSLRLLKLVNTLLDFSRLEAGRFEASYAPTDLAQLTSELASVFRSAIERAGLKLIVNCESLGEPVYVDRELWEKIVFNLLSNAFKFTFQGEIEVSVCKGASGAQLAVRDTGTGIPDQDLPHLFERFYRVKNAQGRTFEGSGIGLALVHELANLHGGSVSVESRPGQGSKFTVTVPFGKNHLPANRLGAARTQSSTALKADAFVEEALHWLPDIEKLPAGASGEGSESNLGDVGARPSILLADDNADMREYLCKLLSPIGDVRAAADGEAALHATREHRPDLIISDVMMPKLDGVELLQRLRADEETAGIPVILLSARAGEESRVEGLDAGADDYLSKPFSARELLARVRSQLKMARMRQESIERERKLRAEAELERNQIRELFTRAPVAIALLSEPGHTWQFVNAEFLKVTGRSEASDFIAKTLRETFPEIEGQGLFARLDEVYRSGVPYVGYEERVVLNRGPGGAAQETYFNFVYQPLSNPAGSVEQIMVVAVDVTDTMMERGKAQRTDSLLASIVDSSDDAIVSKNLDGIIISWNKSAERMFGYSAQEAIGRHITLIVPQDRRSEEDDILSRLRRGQRIDHFETVRRCKDGTFLNVALTISPIRDSTGRVLGASKVARDITEKKAIEGAQKALFQFAAELNRAETSEEVYQAALAGIRDAIHCDRASILLLDPDHVMRFVSWHGLSDGYRNAVQGHSPWEYDDPNPQPICVSDIEKADFDEALKNTVRTEGIRALSFIPLIANDRIIGKFMTYFSRPHTFAPNEVEFSMTIARQLAVAIERQRSGELLRRSEEQFRQLSETLDAQVRVRSRELEERSAELLRQSEQVRELSWRLLKSQDDERRHIARELHDSAGQTLTVLGINLAQILQDGWRGSPELATKLEAVQETVQQLHREIRTTSYLLHPPLLDESGLFSAIGFYMDGLSERSGLKIDLDIPEDFGRLPRDMELVIFRLVQECLTNIHRHSDSKTAFIQIRRSSDQVRLDIRDRGRGMSPERLAEVQSGRSGFGIRGMRERLRQFQGTLQITSGSKGTHIAVAIPLPKSAAPGWIEPEPQQTAV